VISHEHNCIFIHIPKCGGTSVEKIFIGKQYVSWDSPNKIWRQHATAQQIQNELNWFPSVNFEEGLKDLI
jgi:nucleoside-diphosphate-sugar epimerase